MRYDIWEGDLEPAVELTLTGVGSIAGATITFVMKQVDGSKRVSAPAVIDDPDKRIVHYEWADSDTSVPGIYRAVMVAEYGGSRPETFPSDEAIYVVIHARL